MGGAIVVTGIVLLTYRKVERIKAPVPEQP
jgi:hypothetical protein